jgi:hypothetical protein
MVPHAANAIKISRILWLVNLWAVRISGKPWSESSPGTIFSGTSIAAMGFQRIIKPFI